MAVTRDPGLSSAHPATGTDAASAAPAGAAGTSNAQATFAALDSGSAGNAPSWVHASARSAEAGYQDPALGWVGVRAQQDASGVHATVVPVSQDAAQALGTHMAGLTTYLAEHSTPLSSLSMAAPQGASTGLAMDQGGQSHSGQGYGQNASDGSTSGAAFTSGAGNAISSAGALSGDIAPPSSGLGVSGGTYISVIA